MQAATQSTCNGEHRNNGKTEASMWDVQQIEGRRYTVCAHHVGGDYGYCGALIDVTDLPQVVICCGRHGDD